MSNFYSDESRKLQQAFDTERLANSALRLVHATLTDDDRAVIGAADMFFLASADAEGRPTCSYKGGDPGFVRAVDDHTIAFPNYDGNGMYLSMGNIRETSSVGMLFIDFEKQTRMRIQGRASIDMEDPLRPSYPEAQFIVRVAIDEIFPNCPRYIHKYRLEERSRFVPHVECQTPVPYWKTLEWSRDNLAEDDPARDPSREVLRR